MEKQEEFQNMNEAEELIEIPNKNLKLLEKSFSNFKNQLYEKQFGDDYKATTKEEDSNSFEKINSEDFYIYILFHTFLFYKKNRFLIDHGNTKYESIPFDLKKLENIPEGQQIKIEKTHINFQHNTEIWTLFQNISTIFQEFLKIIRNKLNMSYQFCLKFLSL